MTYAEFVKSIKSTVYPDREAQNLASVHTKYVLDALIEIQKRVPELQQCNTDHIPYEDIFYNCKASTVPKPDGPILRAYTTKTIGRCDKVYYKPTTREHMEALMEQAQSCGFSASFITPSMNGATGLADSGASTLARNTIDPPVIQGGRPGTWRIDSVNPAPEGGLPLSLSTEPPGVITDLPTTATIPKGETFIVLPFDTVMIETASEVVFRVVQGMSGMGIRIGVTAWDSTDKGWRSCHGYYAVICETLYFFPNIESTETLHIDWQGIKTSYTQNDEVDFDRDVQSVIELYVQAQTALREDCDINKYTSLQTFLANEAAKLTWWYRKKRLLPEAPWRAIMCKTCDEAPETTSGGGTPPGPGPGPSTFVVYLGNAGEEPQDSYTEAELVGLENTSGSSVSRSILAGDYNIGRPASETNEWRVISFPQQVHLGVVDFRNSGFPFPMAELATTSISGTVYRVFRTTAPGSGSMTTELHNPVTIIPK